ncbi:MAG: hypothetical protein ACYDHH_33525, partial [Solirubrobacteraceae bacterium]
MRRAGRKTLRSGCRPAALAALALFVVGVDSASAGTLNLQLGVDPTGCIAQPWFASGLSGVANCTSSFSIFKYGTGWTLGAASQTVVAGATGEWQINAPAGITIDSATIPSIQSAGLVSNGSYGWQAAEFWAGATHVWGPGTTTASPGANTPLNSSYYGFKLYCYASSCN